MSNQKFDWASLKWDAANRQETLTTLFRHVESQGEAHIRWYRSKKKSKQRWSLGLRLLSIILAVTGGLCPLIGGTVADVDLNRLGYVLIAAAGGLLLFDKLFGLSSSWMRFMVTALDLEAQLNDFRIDWALLSAGPLAQQGANAAADEGSAALMLVKKFSANVASIVRQETQIWIADFQSNLSHLEQLAKARSGQGK